MVEGNGKGVSIGKAGGGNMRKLPNIIESLWLYNNVSQPVGGKKI